MISRSNLRIRMCGGTIPAPSLNNDNQIALILDVYLEVRQGRTICGSLNIDADIRSKYLHVNAENQ